MTDVLEAMRQAFAPFNIFSQPLDYELKDDKFPCILQVVSQVKILKRDAMFAFATILGNDLLKTAHFLHFNIFLTKIFQAFHGGICNTVVYDTETRQKSHTDKISSLVRTISNHTQHWIDNALVGVAINFQNNSIFFISQEHSWPDVVSEVVAQKIKDQDDKFTFDNKQAENLRNLANEMGPLRLKINSLALHTLYYIMFRMSHHIVVTKFDDALERFVYGEFGSCKEFRVEDADIKASVLIARHPALDYASKAIDAKNWMSSTVESLNILLP